MSSQLEIERIVREVVSRLHAGNGSKPSATDSAGPVSSNNKQTLTINNPVITLTTIEGRLEGIRQLALPKRCVVTPAVKDELRLRNIEIVRSECDTRQTAAATLLVGNATDSNKNQPSLDWTKQKNINAKEIPTGTLREVIRQMSDEMKRNNIIGLLTTDRPAAALCLANRSSHVRAVLGCSDDAVREAVQTIGANLLIVDPRKNSTFQMLALARQFVADGPRDCPQEW